MLVDNQLEPFIAGFVEISVSHIHNAFGLAAEDCFSHQRIARLHRVFTVAPELLNVRVQVNTGHEPLKSVAFLSKNQASKNSVAKVFGKRDNQIANRLYVVLGHRDRLHHASGGFKPRLLISCA
nr:hypothetical protein [Ruegeria atlantica]